MEKTLPHTHSKLPRNADVVIVGGGVIGVVTALSLCALVPMLYAGLFTAKVIVLSLAIVPIYSATTWIGACYFSAGGTKHYRSSALAFLAFVGFVTLVIALRSYLVEAGG